MEFTGKVKDISMDWQTGQAQITFTINEKSALASVDSIKNCEKLSSLQRVAFLRVREFIFCLTFVYGYLQRNG